MLSQALSDAVKLVSLRPCPSTLTHNVLFMLDVEREEMKWLKYWKSFPSFTPHTRASNIAS